MAETRQTRRALLTAAASGAAALAANAALGASVVKAAVDEPLLKNVENTATAGTTLTATLPDSTVLRVVDDASNGGGTAVSGTSGPGAGVAGFATTGTGVYGNATAAPGRGVWGWAPAEGTGVFGNAGDPTMGPTDTSLTGVFGYSAAGDGVTTLGAGVWGDSPDFGVYGSGGTGVYGDGGTDGWGVYGWSSAANGVFGEADTGTGVFGEADTGTALKGVSASGYGLYVSGKVKFATRSGRLSVAAGKTSTSKNVAGVTSSNIVIAVLQTVETGTWVRAAVAGTGKFTVYFNRALPSSSVVGWMILN